MEAAHQAYNTSWGLKVPGYQRGKYLIRLAELIEENIDEIAAIETLDNGKAISICKVSLHPPSSHPKLTNDP